jgi:transposase
MPAPTWPCGRPGIAWFSPAAWNVSETPFFDWCVRSPAAPFSPSSTEMPKLSSDERRFNTYLSTVPQSPGFTSVPGSQATQKCSSSWSSRAYCSTVLAILRQSEHIRRRVCKNALQIPVLNLGARAGDGSRRVEGRAEVWLISDLTGRHTAMFLCGRGYDVRDVCANRTPRHDRARQRGKSDVLDSERIARETLAHPLLPKAFKRAGPDQGPDESHQLLALWHNRRRSILTSRQHLLNEAEHLLCELPLELRDQLPDSTAVRPRLTALADRNRRRRYDPPTRLRLQLLDGYAAQIHALDREEKTVLRELVRTSGSTLAELCGLQTRPGQSPSCWSRSATPAGSPSAGFARFNGTAPLPASTAEGPGEPVRHRYNPGGNRRIAVMSGSSELVQLHFVIL